MKLSRYNWIVKHEGKTIAYNGYTGAMAVIEKSNIDSFQKLFSCTGEIDNVLEGMEDKLVNGLRYGGYIVHSELDERDLLRLSYDKAKFTTPRYSRGYTLVMTRKCNFRCTYCFEHSTLEGGDSITDEVLDQVVKEAEEFEGKLFTLSLYGGEPLLEYDKCIDVAQRCKEATENRGAKFNAGVITNGYLLSPARVQKLKESGITQMQITIDGAKETHDANRPLANGEGTYDRIMQNIKECAGIVEFNIRMNVKEPNLDEINGLKEFASSLPLVNVHLAPVDLSCQGDSEFYLNAQKKISETLPVEQVALRHLHSVVGGCGSNSLTPSVVLPNGKLVRCWEHLDDYESSCSIFDDQIKEDTVTFSKWAGWNPYMPGSQCYECRYLPGCGGGCPRNPILNRKLKCIYKSDEEYIKSIIGSYITLAKKQELPESKKENQ